MRIILFFFFITLLSCKNESAVKNPENLDEKAEQVVVKKKKKIKENIEKLNDKNAVEYLEQYGKENREHKMLIKTNFGDIKIILYNQTPLHRANFVRLVKNHYYDDAMFYRVVKGFIIQTGNSDSFKHANRRSKLGKYKLPAEFNPNLIHKRGALSMSRSYEDNPDKNSAAYDFFIVHGTVLAGVLLKMTESEYRREIYGTIGGADHLDNEHTVFGEVIAGMDVVDKIAEEPTDNSECPKKDIRISTIEILE